MHLTEGTGEAFPAVLTNVFISVRKRKRRVKSSPHRLARGQGGVEEKSLTVLVYTLI